MSSDSSSAPSLAHGRLLIVLAAVLWSLSGLFTRLLQHETSLHFGPEPIDGLTIAFHRALFAGLVMTPSLRRTDISFRPLLVAMVLCFAVMNLTFVLAVADGKASNAVLLQYSAPLWTYLVSVCWMGEKATGRGWTSLALGLSGIAVIVFGGWEGGGLRVIGLGLSSGLFFAGVILFLRVLRETSSLWLTVVNHLGAALAVAPLLMARGWPDLTTAQFGGLAVFGAVQMGLPYLLMARGLRTVSPQEAGVITLLEPLLVPLWAYLVAPEKETPTAYTLVGGAFILGALVWRYWPLARGQEGQTTPHHS